MRCNNCPFINVSGWDSCDTFCNVFGYDDSMVSDNRHGNCGCKYNKRTLEKIMRIHEQEMKAWLEQTRKDDELRRIKETMKSGIIKIAGI